METSVCIACKTELSTEADLCFACGTRQDWFRHLQFSGTILSLLVALISVSGIAVPLMVKAFHDPIAVIKMSPIRLEAVEAKINPPGPPKAGLLMEALREGRRNGAPIIYTLPIAVLFTNKGDMSGAVIAESFELKGPDGTVLARGTSDEVFTLEPKAYRVQVVRFFLHPENKKVFPLNADPNRGEVDHPEESEKHAFSECKLVFKVLEHDDQGDKVVLTLGKGELAVHFQ